MWVEEISLDNIKCFDKQSIRTGSTKQPYPWVTFLGENGTGKSTVLQALGLMLSGAGSASKLLTPYAWLKDENKIGKLSLKLHQGDHDPGDFVLKNKKIKKFQYSFYVTGEKKLVVNDKIFAEPSIINDYDNGANEWIQENALTSGTKGWFGAGYGAFRRMGRENRFVVPTLQSPSRYLNFYSQFAENKALEEFETWLVYLDYKISKNQDELAKKQKAWGINAINALLPEGNQFDSIDADGRIWFQAGKSKIRTIALSDGLRSIIALAGDLVWRLIEAFPDSNNPLYEEGVVLIDELDIHLHPTWQRNIAGLLRKTFPHIQFIMATHSPLVAASAGEDAVTYRFHKKGGNVEIERIQNIHLMSVDEILQSHAFGLVSAFSPETQHKIDRYFVLKRKQKLSKEEEKELEQTIPTVKSALGHQAEESETEKRLNEFIKQNWR
jgi:predicted ATPase